MEAQGEWPGEIGGTAQLLPLAPRAEDFRHGPHDAGTPLASPVTPRPFPARSPETARGGFPPLPYSEMTPPGRAFGSGATAGSEPAPWPGTEAETAPAAWSEVRPSPPPAAPAKEEAWPPHPRHGNVWLDRGLVPRPWPRLRKRPGLRRRPRLGLHPRRGNVWLNRGLVSRPWHRLGKRAGLRRRPRHGLHPRHGNVWLDRGLVPRPWPRLKKRPGLSDAHGTGTCGSTLA